MSVLSCPRAQQFSRDIPTYAGVLCDEVSVLGDSIEGTFCIFVVAHVTWCFTVPVCSGDLRKPYYTKTYIINLLEPEFPFKF